MPLLRTLNLKIYSIMKKLFILLSILCSSLCAAQNLSYSTVLQAEGKSAKDIYSSVKMWSAAAFPSVKEATQIDDPEGCFIAYSTNIEYRYGSIGMASYDGWVYFVLIIQCRDGRYKVDMTNIVHQNKPNAINNSQLGTVLADENAYKGFDKKVASDIIIKIAALFDQFCGDLQEAMNIAVSPDGDDW